MSLSLLLFPQWMEKTLDFYDNFNWDLVVDNTDTSLPMLMRTILRNLASRSPQLQAILNHEDSPGQHYFRKRLGSENVLLAGGAVAGQDENDAENAAPSAPASKQVARVLLQQAGGGAASTVPTTPTTLRKSAMAAAAAKAVVVKGGDDEFGPVPFEMPDEKVREPSP